MNKTNQDLAVQLDQLHENERIVVSTQYIIILLYIVLEIKILMNFFRIVYPTTGHHLIMKFKEGHGEVLVLVDSEGTILNILGVTDFKDHITMMSIEIQS